MLPTFYSWSIEHIKKVFEAKCERDCLQALEETFSHRLEFTFNGSPLPRVGLQKIVLAMLQTSGFCLNVDWLNAVEVPRDSFFSRSRLPWNIERDARRILHHPQCQEASPWIVDARYISPA